MEGVGHRGNGLKGRGERFLIRVNKGVVPVEVGVAIESIIFYTYFILIMIYQIPFAVFYKLQV